MNRNIRRLAIRNMLGTATTAAELERREDALPETLLVKTVQTAVELAKTKAAASTVLSRKVNYLVEETEHSLEQVDGCLFAGNGKTPFFHGSLPLWFVGRCLAWLGSKLFRR